MREMVGKVSQKRGEIAEAEEPTHLSPLLVPGRTCWRVEPAERAAFLVDGEAYFNAFRQVALRAQQCIMIVGWDIDTQIELMKGEGASSELPARLGEFLVALLRRKRKLRVFVLNWDYAVIYALERQWRPTAEPGWWRHRRLTYEVDDRHPLGACHHQKLVVIDDGVAFVGGFDLSKSRWDTRAHLASDPRRVDADGTSYPPFHDVQMMVSSEAAGALGDLARARWLRATGRRLPRPTRRSVDELWPPELPPDVAHGSVGIMRTQPAYDGQEEIREIEQAYLGAIKRARHSIYIESQYFTAHAIGRALAARLSEHDGPDVVVVLRQNCDGWLERRTMDSLRARVLHEMELADHYGRLRVYAPMVPGEHGAEAVGVHSKLLIVDDEFVCIGSANVSNRSMGFDTECNLAVESCGQSQIQTAIMALRNGLIAEHLGVQPDALAERIHDLRSLTAAIESLRGGDRTLVDGCFGTDSAGAAMIPEQLLADPERPVAAENVLDGVGSQREKEHIVRSALVGLSLLAAMGALAAAWRWTSLGELLHVEELVSQVQAVGRSPSGLLILMGGFILGGIFVVPVTVLIIATILAFGPWIGAPSALMGSLASAITLFLLGRTLGRYRIQQIAGPRVANLSRRISERGLWAILLVRVFPIAPFSMVNLVAGASPVALRDFILGTLLGMSPGIVIMAAFVDHLEQVFREPTWLAFVALGILLAGAWTAVWYLSGRLQVRGPAAAPVSGEPSIPMA